MPLHMVTALALLAIVLTGLAGCKDQAPVPEASVPMPPMPPEQAGPSVGSLPWAVNGPWRSAKDMARNPWRHPVKTLEFCGLAPGQNVMEVWPGGGWYTQVLAPWLKENGGHYTAALMDPKGSAQAEKLNVSFLRAFDDEGVFGDINTTILGETPAALAPENSLDLVLTFRNVHSWLARGMAAKAFADFYAALKPGGLLCVVEHRLPDAAQQDPLAGTGYVQRALVKSLAADAGFVFDAQSDINTNLKDNTDHPFGVWTLPPAARNSNVGAPPDPGFDRAAYDAIGESNRMTLRFRKPDIMDTKEEISDET